MSSRGIRTRDLAIHDDRRFWPRFSGILGALVKWLSSRTYAQVPLLEEVSFFMVWFDPDLPVLHIHLNNTGPTARLTARCYRAQITYQSYIFPHRCQLLTLAMLYLRWTLSLFNYQWGGLDWSTRFLPQACSTWSS